MKERPVFLPTVTWLPGSEINPQGIVLNMDYSPAVTDLALALTQERTIEPPSSTKKIIKLFGGNLPIDWERLDQDPVITACHRLPLTLLSTLYEEPNTKTWATIVLSSHPKLTDRQRSRFQKEMNANFWIKRIKDAKKDPFYAETSKDVLLKRRRFFARLAAPEICEMFGYNLQSQFLTPVKAMGMAVGYDAHFPNLLNRAAGTQIPLELRQLDGRLRFAQQVRIQESLAAGLCQEVIFTLFAKAHYIEAVRKELYKTLGIKVIPTRWTFEQNEGPALNDDQINIFMETDPLLQTMIAVVRKDYCSDYLLLRDKKGVDCLGRATYQTAVLLNDPAINAALCDFSTMEDISSRELHIPETHMHDHLQTYMVQQTVVSP